MILDAIVIALAAAAAPAIAELGEREEVDMALSAAPEHLRAEAGVYRLGRSGYELVRTSRNGFTCLVSREPNAGTGPQCYDAEGSETTLKRDLLAGKLLRQGKTHDEVEALVSAAYNKGELAAPRKAGVAYMLSKSFRQVSPKTGRTECIFPAHVMVYAPYLKNADIGSTKHFGSVDVPWVLNEGRPDAYILVVPHNSDVAGCS